MLSQTPQQQPRETHSNPHHLLALCLVFLCLLPASASALPTLWQWAHPFPHGNQHNGIVWGEGQFVAVGVGGNIVTSTTGLIDTWTLQPSITIKTLNDIAWNGTRYVSVGDQGFITASDDGQEWVVRTSGTSDKLTKVIWNGSFFLAIGEQITAVEDPFKGTTASRVAATILTSPNGFTWTLQSATFNPDRYSDIPPPRLNGVTWDGTLFVASSDGGAILTSDDGIAWHTRAINSIVWNSANLFLAVGDNGLALTSSDGTNWTVQNSGVTDNLHGVTWGGNRFVAVGENGTILSTFDGITWDTENSDTDETLRSITYSGIFITVGNNGTLLTRSTAAPLTWVASDSETTEDLYDIAWNIAAGIRYVAVGADGALLSSNNGTNWVKATVSANFTTDLLNVSWGNDLFITSGKDGVLLTAPNDGATWTLRNNGIDKEWLFDSVWDNDASRHVVIGSNGTVITSANGTTDWATPTTPPDTSETLLSIAINDANFLVGGGEHATQIISTDADSWTVSNDRPAQEDLNDILFNNSSYTTAGNGGQIHTSSDTIYWTSQTSTTTNDILSLAVDTQNDNLIASGAWGTLLRSTDNGTTWDSLDAGTSNFLYDIASSSTGTPILVTVGSGGTAFTSTDSGDSWDATAGPTQTQEDINGLAASSSLLVAVGNSGVILNSADNGVTWTLQTSTPEDPTPATACTSSHLHDVAWKSSDTTRFVAVGDAGAVCISNDSSNWNSITPTTPPDPSSPLYGIVWGKDQFIAVGGSLLNSVIYTSPDGEIWTLRNSGESQILWDITWDGGVYIAVGNGGTIITSPDGVTWSRNSTGTNIDLYTVAAGSDRSVVTGTTTAPLGTIVLRNDEGSWTGEGSTIDDIRINDLTFGGTQFAGVTPSGSIAISEDGQDWKLLSIGSNSLFKTVIWDGGKFIAAGAGGHILYARNPDLIITGGFLAESARDGDVVRYSFTITNRGITTAANVSYAETMPPGSVLLSATSTRGGCILGNSLICLLGDLATDESATVTIDTTVTSVGLLRHSATVTSNMEDNDVANNTILTSIEVTRGNSDSGGASFSYWSLSALLLFLLMLVHRSKGQCRH